MPRFLRSLVFSDTAPLLLHWFLQGDTPLHQATFSNATAIVVLLLAHCPSLVNSTKRDGNTPLHLAASRGFLEMTKLLLSYGASASSENQGGIKPIDLARQFRHDAIARVLEEHQ